MLKFIICFILAVLSYGQYNQEVSKQLCYLAVAAYCKPIKVLDWSCQPCKGSFLEIQNVTLFVNSTQNTLGYIAVSRKLNAIVLAFRGSDLSSIKNWVANLKFIAIDYPICTISKCRVHQGFYKAYYDINSQVISRVQQYKAKFGIDQIIINGHGLGAAIATHATAHLIKSGIKVTLLQTYGSPRVGNKQFVAWFNAIFPNTLKPRITHGKDPVVHLPPQDLQYKHIPTQVFYQGSVSQGYKICNDQSQEDKNCSDQYSFDLNYVDHGTYYDIDFNGIVLTC